MSFVGWQCKRCKSANISLLGWVNPNTMECEELVGEKEEGSGENFCNDCEESTGLESVYE